MLGSSILLQLRIHNSVMPFDRCNWHSGSVADLEFHRQLFNCIDKSVPVRGHCKNCCFVCCWPKSNIAELKTYAVVVTRWTTSPVGQSSPCIPYTGQYWCLFLNISACVFFQGWWEFDVKSSSVTVVVIVVKIHTRTDRFLLGCEEAENCTSQLVEPRNTTHLYEFYLATTQTLEYTTTQRLHTHLPHGLVC